MDRHVIDVRFRGVLAIACSALILFGESMFAQSSPPLLLDDPGTPGPGKWEINILTSLERSDVNDEWLVPLFDINYGVGDCCQLMVSIPFSSNHEKGAGVRRAFEGMEMGVKYRFVDNPRKAGLNISVYPKYFFSFEDETNREWTIPAEFHMEWSWFGLTAEVGHVWVNRKSDGWGGGLGAALFLDPVDILVEWHTGMSEPPFDLSDPMANVGLTYEWSKTVSLYASFGKSLRSHEIGTNTWCMAGFQFRF